MPNFKPRERLEYIQNLQNTGLSSECHLRCIIHQAYYAALNQLQYEIDNRLFFPVDPNDRKFKSHQAFINACYVQIRKLPENDKQKRALLHSIAQNMKRSKLIREDADYNLEVKIEKIQVSTVLKCSNDVFEGLEKYE
jgi:hypothetical protein